ncbi:hypothetical protein V3N99_10310 [Dermatophilaceae bacterium Soc4.6]
MVVAYWLARASIAAHAWRDVSDGNDAVQDVTPGSAPARTRTNRSSSAAAARAAALSGSTVAATPAARRWTPPGVRSTSGVRTRPEMVVISVSNSPRNGGSTSAASAATRTGPVPVETAPPDQRERGGQVGDQGVRLVQAGTHRARGQVHHRREHRGRDLRRRLPRVRPPTPRAPRAPLTPLTPLTALTALAQLAQLTLLLLLDGQPLRGPPHERHHREHRHRGQRGRGPLDDLDDRQRLLLVQPEHGRVREVSERGHQRQR